jgi:DNA-binding GntR family transcriptional regulator
MGEVKTLPKTNAAKEGEVNRVYRILKSWLIECELAPGAFLAEVELARRCETSRTPVREACNRLVQDGWIVSLRHRGYQARRDPGGAGSQAPG